MKVIILGAGYGTRLQRDIENDSKQNYKHLLDIPKPLLPIGGECLISKWMTTLSEINEFHQSSTSNVYLVSNHHFVDKFQTWAKQWLGVQILDDGSCTNETRLGAIADINLCIEKFQIEDDLLVIGGDTLFYEDFDLRRVLDEFYARKLNRIGGALVTCYQCKHAETTKFGILELNLENQVVGFLEKPDATRTQSRWACPCFYVLSKNASQHISKFLEEKMNAPLKEKDATGHFIKYLQQRETVFAVTLKSGRFDIGSLQSYVDCNKYFSEHSS